MQKFVLILLCTMSAAQAHAQVGGNMILQNGGAQLSEQNIYADLTGSPDLIINTKGLANIKATNFVAIFGITQMGKTAAEANQLIDGRINQIKTALNNKNLVFYIDVVSSIPVYELEQEKKIFNKKTYNELPKGFEIKKNLHIKYTDAAAFNEIMTTCAEAEVYDLVRVDYFADNIEQIRKDLSIKAKSITEEKIKYYQSLLNDDLTTYPKQLADKYRITYPVEMYRSYQAYISSALNLKTGTYSNINSEKVATVNYSEKTTTLYYQPVIDKEFDFVINPVIFEPVIQVMYEIKLYIKRPPIPEPKQPAPLPTQTIKNNYIFITPSGEIRNLPTE